MKNLFLLLFFCCLNSLTLLSQSSLTFHPFQDAAIGYNGVLNSANENYESEEFYGAFAQPGDGGNNGARGLMEFDLSSILQGTIILSATLDLYGRGGWGTGVSANGSNGVNPCYLERITTSWDAFTVTYNTAPQTTTTNSVILPQSTSGNQNYLGIDVTAMVQDMIDNPSSSYGMSIRLVAEVPTAGLFFCSTNFSDSLKHPLLTINLETGIEDVNPLLSSSVVFPNPFHDEATISFKGENADRVVIYNSLSEIVLQQNFTPASSFHIQMNNLADGLYLYAAFRENRMIALGKFIVE